MTRLCAALAALNRLSFHRNPSLDLKGEEDLEDEEKNRQTFYRPKKSA
jgi:hypothetical protein